MKNKMIALLVILTLLSGTFLFPKRSEAAVGIIVGSSPALVAVGLVGTVIGGLGTIVCAIDRIPWMTLEPLTPAFVALGIVGLIVLPAEGGDTITYTEISEKDAVKIGLTHDETLAYNVADNLETLNAIVESVTKSLGEGKSHDEAKEELLETFERTIANGNISKDAVLAAAKISNYNSLKIGKFNKYLESY